jgi:hypothetical protein
MQNSFSGQCIEDKKNSSSVSNGFGRNYTFQKKNEDYVIKTNYVFITDEHKIGEEAERETKTNNE